MVAMASVILCFRLVMSRTFVRYTIHNVRIWGSENPHVTREFQRGGPKVNVWCMIMCSRIISPFFFDETSITAMHTTTTWSSTNHYFPTIMCTTTLGTACSWVPKWNISRPVCLEFSSHFVHQISLPSTSFYGVMLKISCIEQRYGTSLV